MYQCISVLSYHVHVLYNILVILTKVVIMLLFFRHQGDLAMDSGKGSKYNSPKTQQRSELQSQQRWELQSQQPSQLRGIICVYVPFLCLRKIEECYLCVRVSIQCLFTEAFH